MSVRRPQLEWVVKTIQRFSRGIVAAPTARLDYWRCPNGCNANAEVSGSIQTALPRYVCINDIPGMVLDDEDAEEFARYVRSMDLTEVPTKS